MHKKPIANKYREGKMKRTLKRELKVFEIVKKEAIKDVTFLQFFFKNEGFFFLKEKKIFILEKDKKI